MAAKQGKGSGRGSGGSNKSPRPFGGKGFPPAKGGKKPKGGKKAPPFNRKKGVARRV